MSSCTAFKLRGKETLYITYGTRTNDQPETNENYLIITTISESKFAVSMPADARAEIKLIPMQIPY